MVGTRALTVLLLLVITGVAVAADGGRRFRINLTGGAERPGPGDPDGSGTAELRINPGQGRVCFDISVRRIESITAAHIHQGDAETAGPVVVTLMALGSDPPSACVSVSRELVRDIVRNPGAYYVNVHNEPYPSGALRGQLGRK